MRKYEEQEAEVPINLRPLPIGWEWKTLGELSLARLGKTPRKADYRDSGQAKIVKFRDVDEHGTIDWDKENKGFVDSSPEVQRTLKELQANDVLVTASAHMSDHIGKKVGIVTSIPSRFKSAFVVGEMLQIRANEDIEPKWLLHYLRSTEGFKAIQRRVHGVHLIASRAQNIEIPVAPLDQQKCIVAEIEKQFSRLDEAVANLKRVKANLKRYKAAVLKAAVEGRLVETEAELARREGRSYETGEQLLQRILETRRNQWQGKGKYKEPAAPDTTNLPELPEGWVWATMPQLGELNRGKSKHRPRDDARLYGGPYPFIQTGDVRKSNGLITEYSQTYSEFGLEQSHLWPAGTVCITIAANIAETGVLKFPSCFPDSVVGFLMEDGELTTRYVEYFIRTAREKLERFAPATAQKNINLEVLQAVALPLPPLAEQQHIVAEVDRHLSLANEAEAQVNANLQRAERLRQTILSRAFTSQSCQVASVVSGLEINTYG